MANKAYVKNVYDCPMAQPPKHINAHAWCMGNPATMGTDSYTFFSICEIRFGGAAIMDNHKDADHCYFILEGRGYSIINGERFEYAPGTIMWIPGNSDHEMYPIGVENLRFVVTLTSKGFNQTKPFTRDYHEVDTVVPPKHENCVAWPAITPKNGGSNTIEFHITEMFPGGQALDDVHEDADHMYYFIDGYGESIVEGEKLTYGPGDAMFIPKGAKHSMKNTGPGVLKMVASFGPSRMMMRP